MRIVCAAVFAAAVAFGAFADDFEVSAWRGETLAVVVPDYTELGDAPAGHFDRNAAMDGKADFRGLKEAVQKFVNR